MLQRQIIVMLVGILIVLQMSLVFGRLFDKLSSDAGLIKNVKHSSCKPVPGVEGRMLRSLPKPTNSDSCPSKGVVNVGPGNCETKKDEINQGEIKKDVTGKIVLMDKKNNNIFASDLQGELNFASIPDITVKGYMTYDSVDRKMYWIGPSLRVYRCDADFKNEEYITIGGQDAYKPTALAIWESGRILYIAYEMKITSAWIGQNSSLLTLSEKDFNPSNHEVGMMEVDEEERYLYWTIRGRGNSHIDRKPLDGHAGMHTVYVNLKISRISGLSMGPIIGGLQRIFVCFVERTFYIDVNSTGDVEHEVELTEYMVSDDFFRIFYFNGVLYWTKRDEPKRGKPGSIAVMTNYQNENRTFEIKETGEIKEPSFIAFIPVDP